MSSSVMGERETENRRRSRMKTRRGRSREEGGEGREEKYSEDVVC